VIVDTSAILAILRREDDAEPLLFKGGEFARTDVKRAI
jgi:uncharacterized protein with PIN domain